jgi:hypothetical protein
MGAHVHKRQPAFMRTDTAQIVRAEINYSLQAYADSSGNYFRRFLLFLLQVVLEV